MMMILQESISFERKAVYFQIGYPEMTQHAVLKQADKIVLEISGSLYLISFFQTVKRGWNQAVC